MFCNIHLIPTPQKPIAKAKRKQYDFGIRFLKTPSTNYHSIPNNCGIWEMKIYSPLLISIIIEMPLKILFALNMPSGFNSYYLFNA